MVQKNKNLILELPLEFVAYLPQMSSLSRLPDTCQINNKY